MADLLLMFRICLCSQKENIWPGVSTPRAMCILLALNTCPAPAPCSLRLIHLLWSRSFGH